MGEEPVLLSHRDGGVLTLTLNRPHRRNAIDGELWEALRAAFVDARDDTSVRALVLTGAAGAFCAGADLGSQPGGHPLTRMHRVNDVALALHEIAVPTVAKVTGVAVGAGWNLALGCDLVVATPEARFSQIFARRGLSIDFGGSWLLPRLVGMQQAKRLALLAEMISAEEARDLGLVTWLVGADEVDAFVDDVAARLAAGPPIALAETKALLESGSSSTMREALTAEARAQTINRGTDAPAAFRAFVDRTEPDFTGTWVANGQDARRDA
ncbi:2-(1,2-epoxy-1,2-dihydrophenyl)acetyl-CoA isomerase [Pseudonocardia sediminis]|uniref:2-(1,2-epoxy-1,2-dihydrophenyl)acetyl-CoA isomerase n=1 Tax=Pseudonocardia sediminis TaxID=1397368 RepID=A0A4Q7V034_PSEST|nr:enoyl-CoA hydratase-related protein [Pseudonocardia sediminis]RZT86651.1 2-(1,2-epoxy-1,2-dihydrophenyl)acetyl-CoA isomerase [Pseudonocardia sediminis]